MKIAVAPPNPSIKEGAFWPTASKRPFHSFRAHTMYRLLSIALIVLSTAASAQPSKSLEQLRREEQLNKAIVALDDFDSKLNILVKNREMECTMAVGYAPFCGCVLEELPIAWGFGDYVAITTRSKEDNGYSKLNKDMRSAYDKVAAIRDRCVARINARP